MQDTSKTILKGVNLLANTVKQTLGTKGRTILFNDENNRTHITKDGVTVARHVFSEDPYENMVMTVLREASLKTMKSSGDGPQPFWSQVLTPDGFTTMGNLKPGDEICGINNTVQRVDGVFEKGEKEIYKVYFTLNRVVECSIDHLWTVMIEDEDGKIETKTLPLREIIEIINDYNVYTPLAGITPNIDSSHQVEGDKIISIESTGESTEMRCIKVSNPDSLYITDNLIVTHNTTSTIILAQYIINEGLRLLEEGLSFYEMSKQIDNAVKDVVEYVKSSSIKIEDNQELLREIASISANDEKLGDYIYSIVETIGLYGDIEVKESQYSETRKVQTRGMKLHKGWMENFMMNNVRELKFEVNDCYILIIDDTIQAITDFEEYIKYLAGKPIVIFCNDVTDITLSQIQKWMSTTGYPACFVNNDGHGVRKEILMNDLAALTSAYVIGAQDEFDPNNLGFAGQVQVGEWYTSILDGNNDSVMIDDIVNDIKVILEDDEHDDEVLITNVDRKFHRKRLANLTGGLAVIHVGGRTQMEMKELKDRFDDAVLAVGSAIKQGVNVGGGSTYINCQKVLNKKYNDSKGRGYKLIIDALDAPFKQLLTNAELSSKFGSYKDALSKGKALDLRDGKLYKLSNGRYTVYDPSSVLIDSLVNATAVAKSLLSIKDILYNGNKLSD